MSANFRVVNIRRGHNKIWIFNPAFVGLSKKVKHRHRIIDGVANYYPCFDAKDLHISNTIPGQNLTVFNWVQQGIGLTKQIISRAAFLEIIKIHRNTIELAIKTASSQGVNKSSEVGRRLVNHRREDFNFCVKQARCPQLGKKSIGISSHLGGTGRITRICFIANTAALSG